MSGRKQLRSGCHARGTGPVLHRQKCVLLGVLPRAVLGHAARDWKVLIGLSWFWPSSLVARGTPGILGLQLRVSCTACPKGMPGKHRGRKRWQRDCLQCVWVFHRYCDEVQFCLRALPQPSPLDDVTRHRSLDPPALRGRGSRQRMTGSLGCAFPNRACLCTITHPPGCLVVLRPRDLPQDRGGHICPAGWVAAPTPNIEASPLARNVVCEQHLAMNASAGRGNHVRAGVDRWFGRGYRWLTTRSTLYGIPSEVNHDADLLGP